jgi:hypothetical protein
VEARGTRFALLAPAVLHPLAQRTREICDRGATLHARAQELRARDQRGRDDDDREDEPRPELHARSSMRNR